MSVNYPVSLNVDANNIRTAAEWDGKRWVNRTVLRDGQRAVYGARWDKASTPTLTRTGEAAGLVAAAGVGLAAAINDFDNQPIWGEFQEVQDGLGNVFVRVPKVYIRKLDGVGVKSWEVSKYQYPGFYLPWCFWDFVNHRELPHIDVGKYKASSEVIATTDRLRSVPNVPPLVSQTLPTFRTRARNNNVAGLLGYQQLDIHVVDLLQVLFYIEFATLHSQAVMQGYTTGRLASTDVAMVAETGANRIIVSNAVGALYRVGQTISVWAAAQSTVMMPSVFYGRAITAIQVDTPNAGQTALVFEGAPVNIALNDYVSNSGWVNGFSRGAIAASTGSIVANDGRFPFVWRGIESMWGDVWQWVDGVNINAHRAWVTANAENYASNVFAHPYLSLGYLNSSANGWVSGMGFDPTHQFAEYPAVVAGGSTTFYADQYWQAAAQQVAAFGGNWNNGTSAGVSSWLLDASTGAAGVATGGRLLKKAL